MTTFNYSTGNPTHLTAGADAAMNDLAGPFADLKAFINGANQDSTNLAAGPTLIATQQAWQTVAFSGMTPVNLSYMKDSLGFVWFRAEAFTPTSQGAGTTLATLPAGYRPGVTVYFPMTLTSGGSSSVAVSIDTAGLVKNVGALGVTGISFGAVHFRAEN